MEYLARELLSDIAGQGPPRMGAVLRGRITHGEGGRGKGGTTLRGTPKLIEPCILAGCPVGGLVLDPFAAWPFCEDVVDDQPAVLAMADDDATRWVDGVES